MLLLIINLITKPTIVNSVIWKFHSTKLNLLLSYGDKVIPLSLIHLYLNISQRKYWYFCQNAQISALDTIRYKLGFYICLTLMNDFIWINEYISWHHKTLQIHMKYLTFLKRHGTMVKLRNNLDIGLQMFLMYISYI